MRFTMSDIIRLLPDSIANQIAAGEVVQRPASVVKELLENAIDSGASKIELIIKDGGQTSIMVVDNGKGMSETDAFMCWQRHATSKIAKANDLFKIKTFGFRGEALASIAAIAQVNLITKQSGEDLGSHILVEASEIKTQELCSCKQGTSIEVRNLFFNVPARRNFLKSAPIETKHIIQEFQRVALSNPEVALSMFNNDNEVYQLPVSDLEQRVVSVLGKKKDGELLAVDEATDLIAVNGFIGSPSVAKKTRGDQFLFVNGRFIKHHYFNHAIMGAYENLIGSDYFPFFILYLKIDPSSIDINVHPTKTEVNFEDASSIYKILRSIVQKELALGTNAPQIDLATKTDLKNDYNPNILSTPSAPNPTVNKSYNPFKDDSSHKRNTQRWEKLYEPLKHESQEEPEIEQQEIKPILEFSKEYSNQISDVFQFQNSFIVCTFRDELFIINQQAAHERVMYERFIQVGDHVTYPSQQLLFPRTIEFTSADFELVKSLMEEINQLGFDINIFGKHTIIVNGTPADSHKAEAEGMIEGLLENYKNNLQELKLKKRENIARAMAVHSSINSGQKLEMQETLQIIHELFQCSQPTHTPGGKPIFVNFDDNKLQEIFKIKKTST
jgi:DNA mismatch repair protein MutL